MNKAKYSKEYIKKWQGASPESRKRMEEEELAEWQKRNCVGCKFSDKKKVGTGEACCTYYLSLEMDDEGECKTASKEKK